MKHSFLWCLGTSALAIGLFTLLVGSIVGMVYLGLRLEEWADSLSFERCGRYRGGGSVFVAFILLCLTLFVTVVCYVVQFVQP